MREAIRDGRLAPGARLPSTRTLAEQLGIARGTVVETYEQLGAEGWITTRPGARATVVALSGRASPLLVAAEQPPAATPLHDLWPGEPDLTMFPMSAWLSAMRRAARRDATAGLAYGDPLGHPALRHALATYLARARGVVPRHVAVCSGIADGLRGIASTLVRTGVARMAVEDPCLPYIRDILRGAGLQVQPVAVDGEGITVDGLGTVDAVLVTPAHQYPLGMTLSPGRRAAIVRWANKHDAWVIEDDYDGEFRFDRQPRSALQGLDPDRVIYMGTASKSLAPGLRLGWIVLPPTLVNQFSSERAWRLPTPGLDQLALAELITSGAFDRHLRRARATFRQRRHALIRIVPPQIRVLGLDAGLHAVLELPQIGPSENEVLGAAERSGVRVSGLARHWAGPNPRPGLIVGYARPAPHEFEPALNALSSVLSSVV
jgi:GntR family transcriptional regulator / MocR family aminotransferase